MLMDAKQGISSYLVDKPTLKIDPDEGGNLAFKVAQISEAVKQQWILERDSGVRSPIQQNKPSWFNFWAWSDPCALNIQVPGFQRMHKYHAFKAVRLRRRWFGF